MAFEGKVIDRRGSIEANNTLSDNTDIEHEYKQLDLFTILFTRIHGSQAEHHRLPGLGRLASAFKVGTSAYSCSTHKTAGRSAARSRPAMHAC